MSAIERCLLTTKDYTILEIVVDRCQGRDGPLAAQIRRKLDNAVVVFRDDVPADVVTLNSRVTYRTDDQPSETRIIAHDDMRGIIGAMMPLTSPRGLAMLGLSEGQSTIVTRSDGGTETLTVERVAYQPEEASRSVSQLQSSAGGSSASAPFLKVVHRSDDEVPDRPRRVFASTADDFDDPGPSAA